MILEPLTRLYDRLARTGEVPRFGLSNEGISFAVVLEPDGRVARVESLRDTTRAKPRAKRMDVPRRVGRNMNVAANFLWDSSGYVFGITGDKKTGAPVPPTRGEHNEFKRFHQDLLEKATDPTLVAVRRHCERWNASDYAALEHADAMLTANMAFRLEGTDDLAHERAEARRIWEAHLASSPFKKAPCLVTGGKPKPVARLHPKIYGVIGAPPTGASLVSFNWPAFESHGHTQGQNAPVSELAAFKYGAALNTLLKPDSWRRLQPGETTIVWWADDGPTPEAAGAAESIFRRLADPSAKTDPEVGKTREMVAALLAGQPLSNAPAGYDPGTRINVLGLFGTRGRIGVRFKVTDTIGTIARNIAQHWADLALVAEPTYRAMPLWLLMSETAPVTNRNASIPVLAGQVASVMLTGARYPVMLLQQVLATLRGDGEITRFRIAMLKAWLQRAGRLAHPEREENLVNLDTESNNVAYLLGRLFAVFAYAERAVAKRQSPMTSHWMAAASSTPRRAFGTLMGAFRKNITRLGSGKGRNRSSQIRADRTVREIVAAMPAPGELPMFLGPEEQARFFIGFYHQEKDFYTPADKSGDENGDGTEPQK